MEISINKKKIIAAIQRGLSDAQIDIYSSNTITNNRKHMEKWDKINTRIRNLFSNDEGVLVVPLDRGLFKLVLIFDNQKKVLYTVIKKDNFNKLIGRRILQKAHYIDAMFTYNLYQETPSQMSIFGMENMFSDITEKQIDDLHITIETLLSTTEIKQYITIVIDFNGYVLKDVNAVLCSKWLEVLETESLTEYIAPSFDDIEESGKSESFYEEDLKSKISIKPTVKKEKNIG